MATGRISGKLIDGDMLLPQTLQFLNTPKNKNRIEFLCFCIAAFFVLNPILSMNWFVTEDGASHSYNAGVLYKLLFGNDEFLKQYYSINSLPAPNWLGHLLLAFFNEWFGVAAGAKILHLVYGFGLVFSFRWLMFAVSPRPRVMSYLIFPLVFNTIFLFGFYNFCLGIVLFLLGITAWLKYLSNTNWRNLLLLVFLFTCGWFSHILTWLFTGIFVFVSLTFLAFQLRSIQKMLKPLAAAFLSFSPSLVCWLIYTTGMTETGSTDYKPVTERLQEFLGFRFAVMLSDVEQALFALFVVMIIGLLIIGLYRYYQYRKYSKPGKQQKMIMWGAVFIVSLLAVMFFPEGTGGGGVFGIRLEWISWILLLVFVSGFHFPARWSITIAAVALVLSLCRNYVIREACESLNRDAHAVAGAGKYIRDHSTILILPFSTDWLNLHLGKYAVTGRDVAVLSNYECDHQYFPLRWNEKEFPYRYQLASLDYQQVYCSWEWKANLSKPERQVDYVMIVGDLARESDTLCAQKIICAMDSLNYQAVYKKREFTLYEYKPQ
jgi:hypothetical protein